MNDINVLEKVLGKSFGNYELYKECLKPSIIYLFRNNIEKFILEGSLHQGDLDELEIDHLDIIDDKVVLKNNITFNKKVDEYKQCVYKLNKNI